jgi:hypothetical protein
MPNEVDKKSARNCAILFTIIYTPLFIISLGLILIIEELTGDASSFKQCLEMSIPFLTPISMLVCLSISWDQYRNEQYQNINVYGLTPILIFFL